MLFKNATPSQLNKQLIQILDKIPIAVTLIDPEGKILYFNKYSAKVLDRKSDYLGRDIRLCHKKTESIAKIDQVLEAFKNGFREDYRYEGSRGGKSFFVTVSPLFQENTLIGCLHSAIRIS